MYPVWESEKQKSSLVPQFSSLAVNEKLGEGGPGNKASKTIQLLFVQLRLNYYVELPLTVTS